MLTFVVSILHLFLKHFHFLNLVSGVESVFCNIISSSSFFGAEKSLGEKSACKIESSSSRFVRRKIRLSLSISKISRLAQSVARRLGYQCSVGDVLIVWASIPNLTEPLNSSLLVYGMKSSPQQPRGRGLPCISN